MRALTKEEKLKKIFEIVEKRQITAYEIAKNTNLNEGGVGKILQKKSKNPHNASINLIYNYVKNKANLDTSNFENIENNFEEPSELYKNIDPEEVKTAISTFEAYLKTTNDQLKRLQEEPKTADNIREMKNLTKLQLDLLEDLEELKR